MTRTKRPRSDGDKKPARTTPLFSEPWMGRFLSTAYDRLDLLAALKAEQITPAELLEARRRDPAFAKALTDLDQSLTLAAVQNLRARAASGDPRAVSLLVRKGAELTKLAHEVTAPVEDETDFTTAHVFADAYVTGCRNGWTIEQTFGVLCPFCGSRTSRTVRLDEAEEWIADRLRTWDQPEPPLHEYAAVNRAACRCAACQPTRKGERT